MDDMEKLEHWKTQAELSEQEALRIAKVYLDQRPNDPVTAIYLYRKDVYRQDAINDEKAARERALMYGVYILAKKLSTPG